MGFQAKWIQPSEALGSICPVFRKQWKTNNRVKKAELILTALGIYEAELNGQRVSSYVLAPGWTAYEKRLQYQRYDITKLIKEDNVLEVTVGKGWFRSPMPGWLESEDKHRRKERPCGIFGEVYLTYENGETQVLATDLSWEYSRSAVEFSEIYDGESYDASFQGVAWKPVAKLEWPVDILIQQEGPEIREMERIAAKSVFKTSAGETIVDFGQEITGYVEFIIEAKAGARIKIQHGEVLDSVGNFYRENYRSAKAELNYICKEGMQTWHPHLTFYGFRYLKLVEFPGDVSTEQFTAIVVYSDIRRTGYLSCSDQSLNKLFSNIYWSQKGNFLDVPTDCPQRDERLGWTGDAQVFIKSASYNYDVEDFFSKWLHDLSADQREDGSVGQVVPDYMPEEPPSAGWGDAAVICPWQLYLTYGNKKILKSQFDSMKKWVDYITTTTQDRFLWTGGIHFGDWLGLDAPSGSYKGSSREEFIATAFYAYSVSLVVKAGHVIERDVSEYVQLYKNIVKNFRKKFPTYLTQTEHVLAVQFELAEDAKKTVDDLDDMIKIAGNKIQTGFLGTPYILHVLSAFGHTDTAYSLVLRKEYPSWLYSVSKGATTIWEHWDGIMENNMFWSVDMNSFNHYAYGAVADWFYERAAGIRVIEKKPGFEQVLIEPHSDKRIGWLEASINTRNGKISSRWIHEKESVRYEITTEVPAHIIINGREYHVEPGNYIYWSANNS